MNYPPKKKASQYRLDTIQNGTTNFYRFTIPEHAGLGTAGSALIGASVVASYTRAGLTAGRNASGCQESPNSWEIDEIQERLIEKILTATFGPMIAQGADAKVSLSRNSLNREK